MKTVTIILLFLFSIQVFAQKQQAQESVPTQQVQSNPKVRSVEILVSPADSRAELVAKKQWSLYLAPLSHQLRYEKSETSTNSDRVSQAYAFGLRYSDVSVLFENSKYNVNTGNLALNVEREHIENLLFVRLHFAEKTMSFIDYGFFVAMGAGSYQENITTRVYSSQSYDKGNLELATTTALGAQVVVNQTQYVKLFSEFEARLTSGRDFQPNPHIGLVYRLGLLF